MVDGPAPPGGPVVLSARLPVEVLAAALAARPAVLDVGAVPPVRSQGDWGLLRARGAQALWVAIEAPTREAHDHLSACPGAFERVRGVLAAARATRLPVWVRTEVTRSNDRLLGALAAWLVEAGVVGWALALACPTDEAEARRKLPSLGLAVPHALRAADLAARAGLEVVLVGLPRCLLGPFATLAAPEGPAYPGQPCDDCPARDACPGLAPLHRARFGARELRPVDPVPVRQAPLRDALARLSSSRPGAHRNFRR